MTSALLIAVLAGLGGMLGWGFADLFAKKTIDEVGDVATLTIAHLFGILGLTILFFVYIGTGHVFTFPVTLFPWAGLAFFGVLQAAVYLLVYNGFGKGQVAILNPLFSSFSGVVAVISILFLGEVVTPLILLALALVFLGIFLLNTDFSALRERRVSFFQVPGSKEVIAATVLAAIWTLLWDQFVHGNDWFSYGLFMYVFMTIALLGYVLFLRIPLRVLNPNMWKYLALIGFFEMGAFMAISWGYGATTHVSIVALLSGAFSLPTILFARLWLKEKTTRIQLFASLLIIIGIMAVSVL